MIEFAQKKKNKDKIKRLSKVMEDYAPELEKCKKDVETTFAKDPKTMIKDMLGVDVNAGWAWTAPAWARAPARSKARPRALVATGSRPWSSQ